MVDLPAKRLVRKRKGKAHGTDHSAAATIRQRIMVAAMADAGISIGKAAKKGNTGKPLASGDPGQPGQSPKQSPSGAKKTKRQKRSLSPSSSSSATGAPHGKKKRVSFANNLESTNEESNSLNTTSTVPLDAPPGKSILAKKPKSAEKLRSKAPKSAISGPKLKKDKSDAKTGNTDNKSETVPQTVSETAKHVHVQKDSSPKKANKLKMKKKKKLGRTSTSGAVEKPHKSSAKQIQVSRKMKEKLLAMSRKERREFIKALKQKHKPNFELSTQCKQIWEKVRSSKCSGEDRERLMHELYGLIKGRANQLIYAHDTSRVIEYLLTNLSNKSSIRSLLFDELTPDIIRMCKSKYARFFVLKILRTGSPAQRTVVINAFRGHCVSLMRTTCSAELLELAYNDYANVMQRSRIVAEFYGPEYAIFEDDSAKGYSLKDILQKDPTKQATIMNNLEEVLKDIVQKTQVKLSLTHRLLNEFFTYCNVEQKTEMIDSLKDRIPEIVHTNDGARVALRCVWDGTTKERKMIVKNFKGLVVKTCLEEFGHRVLIGIFDVVDDTVLVSKYIVQEIANDLQAVASNRFGERVLHYLVHPRDPRYFGKGSLEIFKEGDNNPISKKEGKDRYAQLFSTIVKPLITYISANLDELLFNPLTALLILSLLEPTTETDLFERTIEDSDRQCCYEAIAKLCSEEFIPYNTEERLHAIEHPQAHFVIAKLLQADSKFNVKLSELLVKLGSECLASWVSCNRGCFILLRMYENGSDEVRQAITDSIPRTLLKTYSTKGAAALLKKFKSD